MFISTLLPALIIIGYSIMAGVIITSLVKEQQTGVRVSACSLAVKFRRIESIKMN